MIFMDVSADLIYKYYFELPSISEFSLKFWIGLIQTDAAISFCRFFAILIFAF